MSGNGIPFLSVVIPTCKRPEFLRRAIQSALLAAPEHDVEVIVVPNGPDESWKTTAEAYKFESRVQWHPVPEAHANVARNHGKRLSRGKYLRFLDDDDYLFPAAAKQLELLERDSAEICSGRLRNMDKDGSSLGQVSFPDTRDFLCATTSISGFTLPTGNIFLRSTLSLSRWDTAVNRAQDYAWMLDLAAEREWEWIHLNEDVGVWFQHDEPRTSSTARLTERMELIVQRLTGLNQHLIDTGRNTPQRKNAIAQGLWYYIHRGFPNHPIYWSSVGHTASKICPEARPIGPLFSFFPASRINPLIVEWLLLPPRAISQTWRGIQAARGTREYKRHL